MTQADAVKTRFENGTNGQSGFTLIELVIAVAILSILAGYAVSRFAAIEDEARTATVLSMEGVVRSASALVHAKAVASGMTSGSQTLELDGSRSIPIHSGYSTAHWNNAVRYMLNMDMTSFTGPRNQKCTADWCGKGNQRNVPTDAGTITTSGRAAKVWPRGYAWNDLCGVHYINDQDGTPPTVGVSLSEC